MVSGLVYRGRVSILTVRGVGGAVRNAVTDAKIGVDCGKGRKDTPSPTSAIRPIFHQREERVEAHIFVAFIAYCLYVRRD